MDFNTKNYKYYKGEYKNTDTAIILASYQPNKIASDILRVALNSLSKIDLDNCSVWVVDIASPNSENLVKHSEFTKFNFLYVNFLPQDFNKNVLKKILDFFNFPKKREGSFINSWSIHFALNYFKNINYDPKYFLTLQTDIIFTSYNILKNLRAKLEQNKNLIAAGFREQPNLGKRYKILHSLGCMWNYDLFKKLNLNLYPKFPDFDLAEYAIAKSLDKGYKTYSLKNARIEKSLIKNIKEDKYLKLGDGVDICLDENSDVVFLHLGRGISKSLYNKDNNKKFTAKEWISWYNQNF